MKEVNFFIGTLSTGGAERVVSNLTLHLNNNILRNILLFGENSRIDYPYEGEILYLDKTKPNNFFRKIISLLLRKAKIWKLKKMNEDSVTISFLEYPNLINSLTSSSGKSIISVRNHMSTKHSHGMKSKFWNLTIKYLYPRSDLIISVSEEIKRDLIKNYKIDESKIKVIYNSYDIHTIQEKSKEILEEKYNFIFEKPVIITAGRLNKQKGHWHLIRSFSVVKKAIPNAQLIILGEGNLESYLKKLTFDLEIDDSVHFLGFQKNPFKYISKSKIFVMTSFHEGFPNALAEAMACGVPVVSSDCKSGPREILAPSEFDYKEMNYKICKNRYGILTPVCDGSMYKAEDAITSEEMQIANSILSILKNQDLYKHFSIQSKNRIKDFEINRIINDWESVIY
ncbi:glycosyltransferase [Facklamia sp. P12945]|uniref:glycosyltransferase n=1 Tax=Facklamia sp. P12945 TaxID=3421950 RepID=UPI003D16F22D